MFSFSSSFSVSIDRIEKCAARNSLHGFEIPPFAAVSALLAQEGEINWDEVRENYREGCELVFKLLESDDLRAFFSEFIFLAEEQCSRLCLDFLKRKDVPLTEAELALPFLVGDFYTLAAERFFDGKLEMLAEVDISFDDAVEFICHLDMPDVLKEFFAGRFASQLFFIKNPSVSVIFNGEEEREQEHLCSLLDSGEDVLEDWRFKMVNPCNCCLEDLDDLHFLLNGMFGKVSAPVLPQAYVPALLEAPYTFEKLYSNLVPVKCPLHEIKREFCYFNTPESLRRTFAQVFSLISEIRENDPAIAYKIKYIKGWFEEMCEPDMMGDFKSGREVGEEHSPWSRPYFLWLESWAARENQNDCVLPDAVLKFFNEEKCVLPPSLTPRDESAAPQDESAAPQNKYLFGFGCDWDESPLALKVAEPGADPLKILAETYLRLTEFLQKMLGGGIWTEHLSDWSKSWWYVHKCRLKTLMEFFADGVLTPDAPITDIGKRFETCSLFKMDYFVDDYDTDGSVGFAILEKYIRPLLERVISEMHRIAADESSSVHLRKWKLDLYRQFFMKKCPYEDLKAELQSVGGDFPAENGSGFSDKLAYIDQLCRNEKAKIAAHEEAAREKVLFEMSHSIKNLVASVSEPLNLLKEQLDGPQRRTVENALAGTGLIRALAMEVHYSMRGEVGAWRKDIADPGMRFTTLDVILFEAVRYAVSNMFDGKYFQKFVGNYFDRDLQLFMEAKNAWAAADTPEKAYECMNRYFFDFKQLVNGDLRIPVGDADGTATKLLILFQELFLNAVKYCSFSERGKRFVRFKVDVAGTVWRFELENSAEKRPGAKSSGIGLAVMQNFAALFEAEYKTLLQDDVYQSFLIFNTK